MEGGDSENLSVFILKEEVLYQVTMNMSYTVHFNPVGYLC